MMRQRGVNIVALSNSWGGGGYTSSLRDSIERAKNAGILFIAAAGNSGNNSDIYPGYPAAYDNQNIISVAAVDASGGLAGFSNYGATTVDVGAPGVSIASTYLNNGYGYMSGTSMATPHVSGIAALLKAYNRNLTWSQIKQLIMDSAQPLSSLQGKTVTGGMANVGISIRMTSYDPTRDDEFDSQPPPNTSPTPTPTPTPVPSPVPYDATITVRDAGYIPQAGAEVKAVCRDGSTQTRYTGVDGKVVLASIMGPVQCTISATKSGLSFVPLAVNVTRSFSYEFVGSTAQFKLTIKLVHALQQIPMVGVQLKVNGQWVSTNSSGMAEVNLPTGEYSIKVDNGGFYRYLQINGQNAAILRGNTTRTVAIIPE